MTKFSTVVRFEIKAEYVDDLLKVFSDAPSRESSWPVPSTYDGMLSHLLIKTGDQKYCSVGLWESEDAVVQARPSMIAFLDTIRHMLEEISPEIGVTDAVSGPVIMEQ
jgi:hypothetical protein